jgi:transcriptional regulator with XRE-family HTH domain
MTKKFSDQTKQQVAEIIRDIRNNLDLSLDRFGEAIDATGASVHYWEQARHVPGIEFLPAIIQLASNDQATALLDAYGLLVGGNGSNGKEKPNG